MKDGKLIISGLVGNGSRGTLAVRPVVSNVIQVGRDCSYCSWR